MLIARASRSFVELLSAHTLLDLPTYNGLCLSHRTAFMSIYFPMRGLELSSGELPGPVALVQPLSLTQQLSQIYALLKN